MAVLWAVTHFGAYIAGRRFIILTDYSALTWLFKSHDLSPKLDRWAICLMEFDVVLQWRAGSTHNLPDARLDYLSQPHSIRH